jgi:hypothetical protein
MIKSRIATKAFADREEAGESRRRQISKSIAITNSNVFA